MPALELDGAVTLNNLHKAYGDRVVVNDVSLEVKAGEFFSMLGPSGCGKTTTLLEIMNLVAPEAGSITVLGRDVAGLSKQERLQLRKDLQIVFQDPFASLDPRLPIGDAIAEPLRAFKVPRDQQDARISELLSLVG